jgi:hypothetical protein
MLFKLHGLVENLGKSFEALSQWDDSKKAAEACSIISELLANQESIKSAVSATVAEAVKVEADKVLSHV